MLVPETGEKIRTTGAELLATWAAGSGQPESTAAVAATTNKRERNPQRVSMLNLQRVGPRQRRKTTVP